MKISLEWLSEYLPGPLDATVAADALTNGGLPVELIERHGDDTVIDVEVTSNRGDCLNHIGVARELSALLDRPLSRLVDELSSPPSNGRGASEPAPTSVRIDAPELCPQYTARIIRGVRVGPSPEWMVRHLEAVGLRAINNIVDVTNYVMFEMGQPLHAFDFDRLAEQRIIVREARGGEKITSIDGHERHLAAGMLVIADARRAVALAGVMGGLDSEVSGATTDVLLESARFDALSTRRTARALAMKSDASYRFERQIDPTLPARASIRAAQLILQVAGGRLEGPLVSAGTNGYRPRNLTLRLAKVRSVLGIDLPTDEIVSALSRLGFSPELKGETIECRIPSWRLDLNIEVDLVEEVARVLGYNRIPVREDISIKLVPPSPEQVTVSQIRELLIAAGHFEAVSVSFISDNLIKPFIPPEASSLLRADEMTRKDNAHLRPSILPGLLEAVRRNESVGTMNARLFEMGSTFWLDSAGKVDERRRLALVGGEDLRDLRGTVELLLNKLDADRPVRIVPADRPGFASGAAGRIEWGGKAIGHLGLADRAIVDALSLRQRPAMAELELSPLLEGAQHVPQLHPLPRFPAVKRDLSLVVAEDMLFERIDHTLRALNLSDLEDLEYVTTYRGKPLDKGTKSVTVTLVFRSSIITLTSEQVEQSVQRAITTAKDQLGAGLRA